MLFWYIYILQYDYHHVLCLAAQSFPTLCDPRDTEPTRRLCPWSSPSKNTGVGCPPPDVPNPGIKPKSPSLQVNSLPSELPGRPENIEVGSLSLLQGIFPTQELNQSLLHSSRILHQLSYQGSLITTIGLANISIISHNCFLSVMWTI